MPPLTRLRVLIADDHAGLVKAVSRLLALEYDVVGSVREAGGLLEAARLLQPNVIVLDVNLPDGDSLTACRQITQENPGMKVIVFTAGDDEEVRERAFEAGASAFVDKLGPVDGLLSAVGRLADTRG